MVRIALFAIASAAIIFLSWRPLQNSHSHGFYRFFGFELLVALILLNAPEWFLDPFSPRQLVSWFLGAVSIGLAIEGFRLLRILGQPGVAPTANTNLAFENTTRLVRAGAYRWIRHPLYGSLLALTGCAYLKNPLGAWSIALTACAVGFFLTTALVEEQENLSHFGAEYAAYMRNSSRFIPFVF